MLKCAPFCSAACQNSAVRPVLKQEPLIPCLCWSARRDGTLRGVRGRDCNFLSPCPKTRRIAVLYDVGEDLANLQALSATRLAAQLGCSLHAYTKPHSQPSSVAEISLDALGCMCAMRGRECRCEEGTTRLPAPLVQHACKYKTQPTVTRSICTVG